MNQVQTRLETLARRVQAIIALAGGETPPITEREAYLQIVEEMELAGCGSPHLGQDFTVEDISQLRRAAAH